MISDRQATESTGHSEEDKKIYLSEAKDFMLGGAGTGFNVIQIFSMLSQDNTVNGTNVARKISDLINAHSDRFSDADVWIHALLVARENDGLVPYEIRIHKDQFYVSQVSVGHRCCGIVAARILAEYFLNRRKIDELPWLEAVQYAIATMTEVGEEVEGVGNLEDFGFDIIVMLEDGSVKEWANCRENSASFSVGFRTLKDISSKFHTFGPDAPEKN